MLRRGVTLLLVPCVLLSQMAPLALAHSHRSVSPADHDLRPHTHVPPVRVIEDNEHDGHHGHSHGHSHHHLAEVDDAPVPSENVESGSAPSHDSDAVYLKAETLPPVDRHSDWSAEQPDAVSSLDGGSLLLTLGESTNSPAGSLTRSPQRAHCPLYVRHLALLI